MEIFILIAIAVITIGYIIYKTLNYIGKLENKVWDYRFAVDSRNAALELAIKWFKEYAVQHRIKNTVESNAKADVNESRAETLRRIKDRAYDEYPN